MNASKWVRSPSIEELIESGDREGLHLTAAEANEVAPIVSEMLRLLNGLGEVDVSPGPPSPFTDRIPGRRPTTSEDPYNAVITLCHVAGAEPGLLSGRPVGVKDNIDVAGVPTTNGSSFYRFVPEYDATVVDRILRAGGRIVAKTNMDDFGAGATGETSAFGPPRNPHDPSRSAGGSSGGSGSALASGLVDFALGGDQGGSARIPASFCGVLGLKATHGLVPIRGMAHLDHSIDFVCPMARSVEDLALFLDALVEPQSASLGSTAGYCRSLDQGAQGLKGISIGIVRESLVEETCAAAVRTNLDVAAHALQEAGARVREVSVPTWPYGQPVTQTLLCHLVAAMVRSEGMGLGHADYIDVSQAQYFAAVRRAQSRRLPSYVKAWILVDRYLRDEYLNVSYGRLHNLRLDVRAGIEAALGADTVLLTPTTLITAPPLLDDAATPADWALRILRTIPYNTSPLNLSGHPALAVPTGVDADGLPTSAQLIGPWLGEAVLLKVARALQDAIAPPRAAPLTSRDANCEV